MRFSFAFCLLPLALALSASIWAQKQANEATIVPRLIRFSGFYHSASQPAQTGIVGATFSIYREQNDGVPLWSEIQNVQPDKDGNYTVLLGSTRNEGVPLDLFTTTETRWLEVEIDQVKQPRILLGSVPYALKAADAETLGGMPASAFALAGSGVVGGVAGAAESSGSSGGATSLLVNGLAPLVSNGTVNYLAKFIDSTDLGNSSVYDNGSSISIGGTANLGAVTFIGNVPNGDAPGIAMYNQGAGAGASVSLDFYNTPYNGGIPQAKMKAIDDGAYSDNLTFWTKTPGAGSNPVTEKVRITSSGNVGIGTTTPGGKLEVAGNLKVSGSGSGILFPDGTMQTTAVTSPDGGNTNAALGALALAANITGVDNTATGAGALQSNNAGGYNTAAGYTALYSNTTGSANTATGEGALYNNTAGGNNTATGLYALYSNTTGGANTAAGYSALDLNSSGSANTAIGESAGYSLTTGNYNINIGYAVSGSAGEASTIRIGGAGYQNRAFIAGISGTTTGLSGAVTVVIDANGQLGTASSSRRFKEDIRDMNDASSGLFRLRPVTFRYKKPYADGSKPLDYGLIAEEVAEVYPDLVVRNADGQIETVQYHKLTSMLLNELQKQNAELASQKDEISSQKQEIGSQKEEINALRERLSRLEAALERISSTSAARP